MKKKLDILIYIMLIISITNAKSQIINCDLEINVLTSKSDSFIKADSTESETNYAFLGIYPITITQTFNLSNYSRDSLILHLENRSSFNQILSSLFFHDLSVFYQVTGSSVLLPMNFSFNGDSIIIEELYHTKKIILKYNYQSDFPMRNAGVNTLYYMQPQISDWHSYFFTCNNMKIKRINFHIPDNQSYFFATQTRYISTGKYCTDIEKITDNDISFYLLKKLYYDKISINNKKVKINVFLNKGVQIDTNSLVSNHTFNPIERIQPKQEVSSEYKQKVIDQINKSQQKITDFFNFKGRIELNIADADLYFSDTEGKKYVWGKATQSSKDSYFITIDTTFWFTSDLTHEMIHAFIKEIPSPKDSTYFLFNESIVEYLAICFNYEDTQRRDSVFNEKYRYYQSLNDSSLWLQCSIFDIKSNISLINGGYGGTSPIIYQKTPYYIHLFAKEIGEDNFFRFLKEFYSDVQKKKEINITNFKKILNKNGISNNQWQNFINKL